MALTIGSAVVNGVQSGDLNSADDIKWIDEFGDGSDLVGMVQRVTITGALTFQASAQQAGRLMTLAGERDSSGIFGVITRAEVIALRELAATPGAVYAVTLPDGREFTAMFRRDAGVAVEAEPVKHAWPHEATDLYIPTIRLVLV